MHVFFIPLFALYLPILARGSVIFLTTHCCIKRAARSSEMVAAPSPCFRANNARKTILSSSFCLRTTSNSANSTRPCLAPPEISFLAPLPAEQRWSIRNGDRVERILGKCGSTFVEMDCNRASARIVSIFGALFAQMCAKDFVLYCSKIFYPRGLLHSLRSHRLCGNICSSMARERLPYTHAFYRPKRKPGPMYFPKNNIFIAAVEGTAA